MEAHRHFEENAALSADEAREVQRAEELLDAAQQDGVSDPRVAQAATILEGLAPEGAEQPGDEY